MKNFLTQILLFVFVLSTNSSLGQITSKLENPIQSKLSQDSNKLYFLVKESFPLNVKGRIFLDDKWTEGTITDFQNSTFKIPLRYRPANEEMQVQHNNKTKALQIQQIQKIEFGEHVFISSYFMQNEEKFMSFFEIVNNGKMKLLKQYESKEKKGIYNIQSHYYSKKGNDPAEKIYFKKKCILDLMNDRKSEVKNFIKKEKINLKKSNDLEKLFVFYNSL